LTIPLNSFIATGCAADVEFTNPSRRQVRVACDALDGWPMNSRLVPACAFALGSIVLAADVHGALAIYTIDPSRSSLLVTGNLTDSTALQQSAGSTVTSYSGTITVDRNGSVIIFPGGSDINAANSGNYRPDDDGFDDTDPASYGRRTPDGGGPFGTTTFEAIRDLSFDLRDDTFDLGATIAANGTFNSSAFYLHLLSGESDTIYGLGGHPDLNLTNKQTGNSNNNGLSSVVLDGSTETLTLKFSTGPITYGVAVGGSSTDSSLILTGTIVATREIPEPSTIAVMTLGAILMLRRRR
jgi:hypothetical protein